MAAMQVLNLNLLHNALGLDKAFRFNECDLGAIFARSVC